IATTLAGAAAAQAAGCFLNTDLGDCGNYPEMGRCLCPVDPSTTDGVYLKSCGVIFVRAGAANGKGTIDAPYGTLAEAAAAGAPSLLVVCAGDYHETAVVYFDGGVKIYGGYTDCTTPTGRWSHPTSATKASETTVTTSQPSLGFVVNAE